MEDIRLLRETLDQNRMEHEVQVTKTKILREHCQEIKEACSETAEELMAILRSIPQNQFESGDT